MIFLNILRNYIFLRNITIFIRHFEMKSKMPILLMSGSGTRLWPLSRVFPKTIFKFFSDLSLFQERHLGLLLITIDFHGSYCNYKFEISFCCARTAFVRCIKSEKHYNRATSKTRLLLFWLGRCTMRTHEDPVILVAPCDHKIDDIKAFHEAINKGKFKREI